jgi:glyoxylase-like metal-dependent hydrolase (beta-lactamase superfamily II)
VYVADPDAAYLDGSSKPPLGNHKGLFQRVTAPLLTRPELPIERLADGDEVGGFEVIRTPGHTPGHTSFYHADLGVAVLGDVAYESDGELSPSPWTICYDVGRNEQSIRSFNDRAGAFEVACVGHGDPIRSGGDRALGRLAVGL